ncbi:partner and localizer of BRCA2 isoform X2 [Synchiropus splendidus]|uniref:partner and localizer of BRCA2 isoform X2 n=1 Tax=Synchiropus splendidus TaxID=270530 RepID=UPI00237E7E83|nr:partner and localizer of BRCA2 isoform X2 [Synchiropus splendidus]
MESVSDFLRYEEKIKSTLHCEDKEKLRKKLALLQKEYLRTAQRLQRAERLEAARKHERSKISEQNKQVQKEPDVSSRLTGDTSGAAHGPQCHRGPSSEENPRPLIGFQLTTDPSCPFTPDIDQDTSQGNRSSPSLRLRSRRSRLRLEKRIAESAGRTCHSQEGQNRTEETSSEPVKDGDKIVNGREDLILDSQSLLLPHWNSQGERVDAVNKEGQISKELHDGRESDNSFHITSEAQNEGLRQGSSHVEEKMDGQNKDENVQQTKQEETSMGPEQGSSLLDSCTLVEGLLFPAEYYVRTTRRMALSHSQPDMQAVILSQLSVGRPRRSRGARGHGCNVSLASKNTQSESLASVNESDQGMQGVQTSIELSGNTPDSGDVKTESFPSTSVCNSRRGKRKRGRGRGKPTSSRCPPQRNMPQQNLNQSCSENSSNPLSSASSSHSPDTLSPVVISQKVAMDDVLLQGSPSTVGEAQTRPTEKVYPIFLKSSSQNSTSLTPNGESLQPLSLPSTPSTQSSLLPLPSLLPHTLLNCMENLDLQQDFYLPDDQFASLKLQKLTQVSLGFAVEDFTSSNASSHSRVPLSDPKSPLTLPSTLTPTVSFGPRLPVNKCSDGTEEERNATFGECAVQSNTRSMEGLLKDPGCNQDDKQVNRWMDPDPPTAVTNSSEAASDSVLTGLQSTECSNIQYETKLADLKKRDLEPSQSSRAEPAAKCPKPVHKVNTQLLLSPSPAPDSSPILPTLGFTPLHDIPPARLTSSPAAPVLSLPPSPSPSTLSLSPPVLSPSCSPSAALLSRLTSINDSVPRDQGGNRTLTLKAPAGAALVDVCCPVISSGHILVAVAGKQTVFLCSLTSHTDWTSTHTWTFNMPVINMLPIPDSDGLLCVTLGELEIREVRVLSCVRLADVLLCAALVDTVVATPESRVVTSCSDSFGSTLQVFTLSDNDGPQRSQTLVRPGACVRALAAVEGLSDALLGCDEAGHLFIWNIRTGQLLQKIVLAEGLSHAVCLRGYSEKGLLLVLLQDHYLSCGEGDKEENAVFSLLAINPLSGKSVLVSSLYPPKSWCGRLCDADVSGSRVVGISQSGCVCVWELRQATGRMVTSPGPEAKWSLARWSGNMLITAQHSGHITLHFSL